MTHKSILFDPSGGAIIGVARRDITPPVDIYSRCWGAAEHDVAEGVHRPLIATAIALLPPAEQAQDAGKEARPLNKQASRMPAPQGTLVLVAVDAGWWQVNDDEWYVRGAMVERLGLDPAAVMVGFTHTHAAPSVCAGDRDKPGGHLIAAYLEQFRDAIVDAADEAIRTASPATLAWAYGRCNMATNRDLPDPDRPRIVCGHNPNHVADDTVLVGRITDDANGRIMGTIVNYACHATTLAWDNKLLSPDFVGAMREIVERDTGGAPCAYLQGCSGELSPREQYVGDTEIADRNGRQLGYAALSALESMLPPRTALQYTGVVESGAPLATWGRVPHEPSRVFAAEMIQVPLPLKPWKSQEEIEREAAACENRVMAERLIRKLRVRQAVGPGATCDQAAWIWRIGDAILVGHPNEAYSDFQLELRKAFPESAVVVMNLVNGCVGYLSPAELHDLDIYQVWQCPFDRDALSVLTAACEQAAKKLLV